MKNVTCELNMTKKMFQEATLERRRRKNPKIFRRVTKNASAKVLAQYYVKCGFVEYECATKNKVRHFSPPLTLTRLCNSPKLAYSRLSVDKK